MKIFENGEYTGERALYSVQDAEIRSCRFFDGESPLKESSGLVIRDSVFEWKYPLWYCRDVKVEGGRLAESARSGIWYTENIEMKNTRIDAPKTFRRSSGIHLDGCDMENALESLWYCRDVTIKNAHVVGDYLGLSAENVYVENLRLDGNYFLDGAKNVVVKSSYLNSKDSFWNCENVEVYDSVIIGEYIGWNTKNIKFVNCKIESNQGFCYMENLTLENCVLKNTDLAFEFSSVNATVNSKIDSVKNVKQGKISALEIGEIIMNEKFVDPKKTEITVKKVTRGSL
jgi:polygalacturonase